MSEETDPMAAAYARLNIQLAQTTIERDQLRADLAAAQRTITTLREEAVVRQGRLDEAERLVRSRRNGWSPTAEWLDDAYAFLLSLGPSSSPTTEAHTGASQLNRSHVVGTDGEAKLAPVERQHAFVPPSGLSKRLADSPGAPCEADVSETEVCGQPRSAAVHGDK